MSDTGRFFDDDELTDDEYKKGLQKRIVERMRPFIGKENDPGLRSQLATELTIAMKSWGLECDFYLKREHADELAKLCYENKDKDKSSLEALITTYVLEHMNS